MVGANRHAHRRRIDTHTVAASDGAQRRSTHPARASSASAGHRLDLSLATWRDVDAAGGDIVEVLGPRGPLLGAAFYSESQITLRLLTRGGRAASKRLALARG